LADALDLHFRLPEVARWRADGYAANQADDLGAAC
jgi:hypothetical protein